MITYKIKSETVIKLAQDYVKASKLNKFDVDGEILELANLSEFCDVFIEAVPENYINPQQFNI